MPTTRGIKEPYGNYEAIVLRALNYKGTAQPVLSLWPEKVTLPGT